MFNNNNNKTFKLFLNRLYIENISIVILTYKIKIFLCTDVYGKDHSTRKETTDTTTLVTLSD